MKTGLRTDHAAAVVAGRFDVSVDDAKRIATAMDWLPRFFDRIYIDHEDPDACWVWNGANNNGYGVINVDNKSHMVHRVAYEFWHGPISAGLQIDHLCRVRPCCNPAHLEAVTASVNQQRIPMTTVCRNGHDRTEATTYLWRGKQICRLCRRRYDAQRGGRR